MSSQNGGSIKVPGGPDSTGTSARQPGTTITVKSSAGASTNLPLNSNGSNPRFVRLTCEQNWGAGQCFVNLGWNTSVMTPSLNGVLISSQGAQILDVKGMQVINAITRSSSAHLNVVAIDE